MLDTSAAATPAIFNLTVLVPLLPFLTFVLIVLWANRSRKLSVGLAIGGIGLSWVLGWAIAFTAFRVDGFGADPFRMFRELAAHRVDLAGLRLGGRSADRGHADHGAVRLLPDLRVCRTATWGSASRRTQHDERGWPAEPGHADPLASRFFAYIALFATGMLGLILSDNLIMLFIFWEIMGLCSYLLIGFWFARKYADPKQITPKEAGPEGVPDHPHRRHRSCWPASCCCGSRPAR